MSKSMKKYPKYISDTFPEVTRQTNIEILLDKKEDSGYRVAGHFAIQPVYQDGNVPEFHTTSNNLFIEDGTIISSSPLDILIRNGILVSSGQVVLPDGLKYTGYTFYREFIDKNYHSIDKYRKLDKVPSDVLNENDCLKFAESIAVFMKFQNVIVFTKQLQQDLGPMVLQFKDAINNQSIFRSSRRDFTSFGIDDENNRRITQILREKLPEKVDNNAVPDQGEIYAMVSSKHIDGKSDYHIAFVIYNDNNINITLEAEADNGLNYQPKFCIYDRQHQGNTFHRRWTGELYQNRTSKNDKQRYKGLYNNGHTVVLSMKHDISDINSIFDNGEIPSEYREPVPLPVLPSELTKRKRYHSKGSRESRESKKYTSHSNSRNRKTRSRSRSRSRTRNRNTTLTRIRR